MPDALLQQAKEKRVQAARARRLAFGLTWREDYDRLLAIARALEAEAGALEWRAAKLSRTPAIPLAT